MLAVLQKLKGRLWLPHQAALEYQRNRAGVLLEQVGRFDAVFSLLKKVETGLAEDLEKLQLRKRHPSINPEEILSDIRNALATSRSKLEKLQAAQQATLEYDPIHDAIVILFDGQIGDPYISDELKEIYKEGAERYQHNRPPGYMDRGKAGEDGGIYYFESRAIQAQFGDLLIWKQLLCQAKSRKVADVIFVTDDDKEDWWHKHAGRTIGPRRELIDEMRIDASVERFHMYNSERFIEYAHEHLGVKIQAESIKDIERTKGAAAGPSRPDSDTRMRLIEGHLRQVFFGGKISRLIGSPADFVVDIRNKRYGIIAAPFASDHRLWLANSRLMQLYLAKDFDELLVVVASSNPANFYGLKRDSKPINSMRIVAPVTLLGLLDEGGHLTIVMKEDLGRVPKSFYSD
jgi:hypothetical protein